MTRWTVGAAIALSLLAHQAAAEPPTCFNGPHGECVLFNDRGGISTEWEPFIEQLRASGRRIVIRGDCSSYCTIAADQLRAQTCLGPDAGMHFHKLVPGNARDYTAPGVVIAGARDPSYTPPVAEWIKAKGGLMPAMALFDTLYMPHEEALRIWRAC